MHSMTAALAANTTTQPPDPAAQEQGGWVADAFATAWNWGSANLPGGNFTMLGALLLLAVAADQAGKKKAGGTATPGKGLGKGIVGLFKALWGGLVTLAKAVWGVVRFYGGRELRGEPRSTATFFKAGAPIGTPVAQVVSMASVALAPPKVSLVKPRRRQPSPWARNAASWIEGYRGKGAAALDRAVRTALWLARAAGKVWRFLKAVWRFLAAVYAFCAPVVATFARALGAWHCWPYAARGLARLGLTAALVGLAVPAWRVWTIVLLVLAVGAGLAAAHRFQPKPPGDDVVYGPKIWTILRADLGLPEDEPWENWLSLPERLAADGARIVIRLPWTFRGSELDRQNLGTLINSRVPGEWVARFSFTGEHATAVYTHKPPPAPPKPEPTPPDAVDLSDPRIQEALANLAPEEFLLGVDENDELVKRKMTGELSHWAYSVGSGGGKSTTLQWLAVQMLMKKGTIVGIDPKLISLKPLEGIPGVHLYKDPNNAIDMRRGLEWAAEVTAARFFEIEQGTATEFPPLYVFLEECNELSGLLRAVWNRIRIKTGEDKEAAADPIWEDVVAYMLRFGRAANVHLIAVFQDFKDNQFGGTSLQPLFRLKILGNYDVRQWERITGMSKSVMPPNVEKAGRMAMVSEGSPITYQTPYLFVPTGEEGEKRPATETEAIKLYNQYYRDLRERFGYSDHGLYVAPPAVSPQGVPKLLQGRVEPLSRDTAANGPTGGSEGGLSDETAGRGVTSEGDVTPGVTPRRDRLRLIPGQAGGEGSQDPLAAPVLLSVAEVAREMQARGYVIEAELIRKHKSRRDKGNGNGFPVGIGEGRDEKFTLTQLITYYEQRGIEKREESEEETEQGDAI
ncbi:hypothetical protein ACFY8R_11690 [Micrococcus luteus]|uniref:hypothetical protein n=1 Tax=Micrococcus luteus TaxID=1270 RepID=UPI0036763615